MRSVATVTVIGAGPAGLAAANRLRAEPGVTVRLVVPNGTSDHLPGVLPVATGDVPLERFRSGVRMSGVEVVPSAVEAIEGTNVRVDGEWLTGQAVIAAPGLSLVPIGDATQDDAAQHDADPSAGSPRAVAFWDLDGAVAAASALDALTEGVLTVVIAAPLYRCPPAPYGLAMRLAHRMHRLGRPVRVRLTTPEPRPLAALGTAVGAFLADSCAQVGVEVDYEVLPDPEALAAGVVTDGSGMPLRTDLAVVIPPHRAHRLLADLAGENQLVPVDAHGRTAHAGLHVVGDAASGPYPRAAGPAVVSGIAAAEGALADLGLGEPDPPITPEPDCFVDRGGGDYARIRISYPEGPPPNGAPQVGIEPSAPAATGGFDAAAERWRALCAAGG